MPLEELDLANRCLVRHGEQFTLLPARHPPVEEAFPASFMDRSFLDTDEQQACWSLTSDGISNNLRGGCVVVIQPLALPLEHAWIRHMRIRGRTTNIRAEMKAMILAVKAAKMILRLRPTAHVVAVMMGHIQSMSYVHELAELQAAWDSVQERITLSYVRRHAGDPANTLADEHANLAREGKTSLARYPSPFHVAIHLPLLDKFLKRGTCWTSMFVVGGGDGTLIRSMRLPIRLPESQIDLSHVALVAVHKTLRELMARHGSGCSLGPCRCSGYGKQCSVRQPCDHSCSAPNHPQAQVLQLTACVEKLARHSDAAERRRLTQQGLPARLRTPKGAESASRQGRANHQAWDATHMKLDRLMQLVVQAAQPAPIQDPSTATLHTMLLQMQIDIHVLLEESDVLRRRFPSRGEDVQRERLAVHLQPLRQQLEEVHLSLLQVLKFVIN